MEDNRKEMDHDVKNLGGVKKEDRTAEKKKENNRWRGQRGCWRKINWTVESLARD